MENPGMPFSKIKALIPFVPLDLSVMAKTTNTSASLALVMNIFEPFST